jgi:cystathionine beta-lyase
LASARSLTTSSWRCAAPARFRCGFDSLIIPFDCDPTATKWSPGGPTLRLHIGLENIDDLKADLDRGFAALKAAA